MDDNGVLDISTHTPARGVTYSPDYRSLLYGDFNPHSREGSDPDGTLYTTKAQNFNPHSREGSDSIAHPTKGSVYISTHTPARGVTPQSDF